MKAVINLHPFVDVAFSEKEKEQKQELEERNIKQEMKKRRKSCISSESGKV